MLLPTLDVIQDLIGIRLEEALALKRPDVTGADEVSMRTLANWKKAGTKPQDGALRRAVDWLARRFGAPADLMAMLTRLSSAPRDPYRGPWDAAYTGAAYGSRVPGLEIREAMRLVNASYGLKRYYVERDPQGLAAALEALDLPTPEVTRAAIARLKTLNDISVDAMGLACAPIILTNLLYLLACWSVQADAPVDRLIPLASEGGWKLPMSRWLDTLRERMGMTNDAQIGELFFPHWSADSCKREMKKWRKGELPSWKAIRKMPARAEDPMGFYLAFAIIRMLHNIHAAAAELEGKVTGFSQRAFFEGFPELLAFAKARADQPAAAVEDSAVSRRRGARRAAAGVRRGCPAR